MAKCPRCKEDMTVHIMSMFNEQDICLDCSDKERKHPEFENARAIESEAVKNGDFNFPGVGLPDSLIEELETCHDRHPDMDWDFGEVER